MYCLRVINEMCLSGEKEKKKYYHCTNNRRDLILEPYSIGYDRQNSFLLFLFIILFFVKCYTNCIVRFIATIRCNYFFSLSYFIIQHLKPIELDFACCWDIWFSLHLHMQRHLSNSFFFVYQIILESAPKINSLTYQATSIAGLFCFFVPQNVQLILSVKFNFCNAVVLLEKTKNKQLRYLRMPIL